MCRSKCRRGLCKWIYRSDNRPQPPVLQPVLHGDEAGAIGFNYEEDRTRLARPHPQRFGDGDQSTAWTNKGCRAIQNLTAEHVKHHIDLTDVFEPVLLQIQEVLGP